VNNRNRTVVQNNNNDYLVTVLTGWPVFLTVLDKVLKSVNFSTTWKVLETKIGPEKFSNLM